MCYDFDQASRKEDNILREDRISHDSSGMSRAQLYANEQWSAAWFSLQATDSKDSPTSSYLIAVNLNTNI